MVNCIFPSICPKDCEIPLAEGFWWCVESPCSLFFPPYFMSYVVASKVKELLKSSDMMTAGDLADALSKHVEDALKKAAKRAQENGRKTVRACDL